MRAFILFILLVPIMVLAQKSPIGILVKFDPTTSFETQTILGNSIEGLKPLQREHVLKGFDVTLFEGNAPWTLSHYQAMQAVLEINDLVRYTSIIYQTESGAIAADLQEMYVKPKNPNFDPSLILASANCDGGARHYFMKDVFVFTLDKFSDEPRVMQAQLMETGLFDYVSVNTLHTILATVDDPYFENQWALENNGTAIHFDGTPGADMSVPEAWGITTGSPTIKVAVLDSGTDTNHVDLIGNLLPGFDGTGGGSLGYPNTTYSNDGHGTCTAGIIAALGDNGVGIAGVAYSAKVIPIKIFYYVNFGGDIIPFTSSEAGTDGIIWAVNSANADILSNSWGLGAAEIIALGIDTAFSNDVIRDNIAIGREGKGTPMLFSSGNDADNFSIWPASLNETISVGASSMCDELKSPTDCSPEGWWGSNYGANLDVTAPGVKVLSTDMTGPLGYNGFVDTDYAMFNGTSAACPNAAGVMALILSVDPSLSAFDARAVLSITADKNGGYDYDVADDFGWRSTEMGYGRVNAFEAVYYASNFSTIPATASAEKAFIATTGQGEIFNGNGAAIEGLRIFNLLGECMAEINVNSGQPIFLNQFLIADGLYFIAFNENGADRVLKVVIQH